MRSSIYLFIILFLISACDEDIVEYNSTEKFNSIFDNLSEDINYTPLDIIETNEGGYLVLSKLANNTIFVLKVSNRGDFQWSRQLEPQYVDPIAGLVQQGDKYYFIAATNPNATSTLFEINDLEQKIEPLRTYDSYPNPLAFNTINPNTYLLLTYNDTTGMVLSKIQDGFAMEWARRFDTVKLTDQNILTFRRTKKEEFFVGAYNSGSVLYFNGLRGNSLNLTYTNDQGIQSGLIESQAQDKINSITEIGSGLLAINYFYNNQSYFVNSYSPIVQDTVEIEFLGGGNVRDRLSIQKATSAVIPVGNSEYLVNAYTTLDGRIKLNFYDQNSGDLVAIKYIGGIDPLAVVKIAPTQDEGMIILSKITLAGTKERINIFKIPKEEILEIL
ncbi:hypothetical protein [Marivirga arenosa]|uniref:Lipoprotein n=1 Tax=Marivirga arenosa TaxID=3059076 RepID=A0AA51ZVE5_9BACT|nr:hypothetical protein [Marivirga sp. BKB1-2]WNB17463.1 hypothetical protein QYS47_33995 [Marivirga sp. BKB1-2]